MLQHNQPFYLEGSTNTCVLCENLNQRPGYDVHTLVWMNSAGEVVGNGHILDLKATKDNAGVYFCAVPSVPLIAPAIFEVVVYGKL